MRTTTVRALAALFFTATPALAQIATDGTMGPRTSFSGTSVRIPSAIGTALGRNLFHSFTTFNVSGGQTVTFDGTNTVLNLPDFLNILGRVTGGSASTILGTIRSTTPGTSLYLINPNGIVFGAGGVVDVNGSFFASSAHYLRFADGTRFESRLGSDVRLSFAAPSGFGFGEGFIAPLSVQGATLRVRDGATIGLVGGGLLAGGVPGTSLLQAFGGNVILVAVASPGEVRNGSEGTSLSGFGAMADVLLQRGARMSVSEGAGRTGAGAIYIRGHDVALDQALVFANTVFANGRGIDIEGSGDITMRASDVTAVTTGAGTAGTIRLAGRNVVVLAGTLVDTSCDPGCTTGNGGLMELRATDAFIIRSASGGAFGAAYVVSNSFGGGRAGEIQVDAGTLVVDGNAFLQGIALSSGDASAIRLRTGEIMLLNGGQVDASARGTGRGGAIVVQNAGTIRIEGTRTEANGISFPSGFFSNADASGDAGSITISTRTLDVLRGAEISSTAQRGSTGAGGSIVVNASERIRITGTDEAGRASGIVTNTFATGDAGEIRLSAPTIEITNEGKVQSQSEGDGKAGRIHIEGRDLTMTTRGQVSSDARARGDAGAVEIVLTGTLSITDGNTGIFAKTYGPAHGGSIFIAAPRILLGNAGGIFATTDGSGDAGSVVMRAGESIFMDTRSRITSETTSSGSAGSLDVRSDGRIVMNDQSRISTSTNGTGNAGSVAVYARDGLSLSQSANIASESLSAGLAGNVEVGTDGLLEVRDGGRITTAARSSDGGNITVSANSAFLDAGRITTEVGTGQGGGGNMEIRIPTLVLRNSIITANAFGGPGGNIHIATKTFIPSPDSRVTASSQLGVDGTITIESPAIDPTGELLVPAVAFFDAGSVLAGRCGPRLAGRASSLVVEPRRLADVAPDALRNMLEILAPQTESCPAPAARS